MTEAHSARAHAKLAPSAAHRWMNCPGSVLLSAGFPNTSSRFAAEGTAAHELASYCLSKNEDPVALLGHWVNAATGEIVKSDEEPASNMENAWFEINEDMADAVQVYTEYFDTLANAPGAVFEIEQRLDMRHLHPSIFGTGDGLVFHAERNHLDVLDYKHGKGVVVSADENEQLMLYAAGAARRFAARGLSTITLHIVQPRAPGPSIKSYEIDILDLMSFEAKVIVAAKATEVPGAVLVAGDWCGFCPALAVCPKAREAALRAAVDDFDVDADLILPDLQTIPPERLARILKEADRIHTYAKAVQEYAHQQAMAGNMPTGFKLVAKRATRRWADEAQTVKAITTLGRIDEAYTEPKLKSPAQLEKLFPGKNKAEREIAVAPLVVKNSSGTNLVPVEDLRTAVEVGVGADFADAPDLD